MTLCCGALLRADPRRTERAADHMSAMMQDTVASPLHGGVEADGDQTVLHYSTDRVLARLEVDSAARVQAYRQGWLGSWRCWCPPACIIYNTVCCSTLHMLTRFAAQERMSAESHRLTLREKTLLFEVDDHVVPAPQGDGTYLPTCCWPGGVCSWLGGPCAATCGDSTHVPDRMVVIRLAELESIEIEPARTSGCGLPAGPDHLVVTVRPSVDEQEALHLLGMAPREGKVVCVIAGEFKKIYTDTHINEYVQHGAAIRAKVVCVIAGKFLCFQTGCL